MSIVVKINVLVRILLPIHIKFRLRIDNRYLCHFFYIKGERIGTAGTRTENVIRHIFIVNMILIRHDNHGELHPPLCQRIIGKCDIRHRCISVLIGKNRKSLVIQDIIPVLNTVIEQPVPFPDNYIGHSCLMKKPVNAVAVEGHQGTAERKAVVIEIRNLIGDVYIICNRHRGHRRLLPILSVFFLGKKRQQNQPDQGWNKNRDVKKDSPGL